MIILDVCLQKNEFLKEIRCEKTFKQRLESVDLKNLVSLAEARTRQVDTSATQIGSNNT